MARMLGQRLVCDQDAGGGILPHAGGSRKEVIGQRDGVHGAVARWNHIVHLEFAHIAVKRLDGAVSGYELIN